MGLVSCVICLTMLYILNDMLYLLTNYRLQLKRGLFWYRHYPKLHQMVKYGSSQVLVWTIRRQITLRVFFNSKKSGKMTIWSKKNTNMKIFVKKIFEKLHASHQSSH